MSAFTLIEFDRGLASELREECPGITSVKALAHHAAHEFLRLRRSQKTESNEIPTPATADAQPQAQGEG